MRITKFTFAIIVVFYYLLMLKPIEIYASQCIQDSIVKIEISSTYGMHFPKAISRIDWADIDAISNKIVINEKSEVSDLMGKIYSSEKIENLDYDTYDPGVRQTVRVKNKYGMTIYNAITPDVLGVMKIYRHERNVPELIWLYLDAFDAGCARYRLPDGFWGIIYNR